MRVTRLGCTSNLACPLLPPSPLNNLSQGNWPPTISPIRGAMHLNATNAEILLQMMHSSVPPRSVQYFARLGGTKFSTALYSFYIPSQCMRV